VPHDEDDEKENFSKTLRSMIGGIRAQLLQGVGFRIMLECSSPCLKRKQLVQRET
jgi:hypothetical protein